MVKIAKNRHVVLAKFDGKIQKCHSQKVYFFKFSVQLLLYWRRFPRFKKHNNNKYTLLYKAERSKKRPVL